MLFFSLKFRFYFLLGFLLLFYNPLSFAMLGLKGSADDRTDCSAAIESIGKDIPVYECINNFKFNRDAIHLISDVLCANFIYYVPGCRSSAFSDSDDKKTFDAYYKRLLMNLDESGEITFDKLADVVFGGEIKSKSKKGCLAALLCICKEHHLYCQSQVDTIFRMKARKRIYLFVHKLEECIRAKDPQKYKTFQTCLASLVKKPTPVVLLKQKRGVESLVLPCGAHEEILQPYRAVSACDTLGQTEIRHLETLNLMLYGVQCGAWQAINLGPFACQVVEKIVDLVRQMKQTSKLQSPVLDEAFSETKMESLSLICQKVVATFSLEDGPEYSDDVVESLALLLVVQGLHDVCCEESKHPDIKLLIGALKAFDELDDMKDKATFIYRVTGHYIGEFKDVVPHGSAGPEMGDECRQLVSGLEDHLKVSGSDDNLKVLGPGDDLRILEYLVNVYAKWEDIGMMLGISLDTLQTFKHQYMDDGERMTNVVNEILMNPKGGTALTFAHIANAVQSPAGGCNVSLAAKIAKEQGLESRNSARGGKEYVMPGTGRGSLSSLQNMNPASLTASDVAELTEALIEEASRCHMLGTMLSVSEVDSCDDLKSVLLAYVNTATSDKPANMGGILTEIASEVIGNRTLARRLAGRYELKEKQSGGRWVYYMDQFDRQDPGAVKAKLDVNCLKMSDLPTLMADLNEVSSWMQLGIGLRVPMTVMTEIDHNQKSLKEKKKALLKEYINNPVGTSAANMKSIIKALKFTSNICLANTLSKKYEVD